MKPIINDIYVKANRDLGFSFNETDAHEMYLVFKKYEDKKEAVIRALLDALEPDDVDLEQNMIGEKTISRSYNNDIDEAICNAIRIINYKH